MNISPRQLYQAQGGLCFHCGNHMTRWPEESSKKSKGWTREHFIPKSFLKRKKWKLKYNIVLAHGKCNRKRDTKFPTKQEIIKFYNIYKNILNFSPKWMVNIPT